MTTTMTTLAEHTPTACEPKAGNSIMKALVALSQRHHRADRSTPQPRSSSAPLFTVGFACKRLLILG